jgi:uncharacterized protein YdeI (YjbR/CyaY-like superfamily)
MSAAHFSSAPEFRRWLQAHHGAAAELFVLFHRKASGKGGITYQEALDEALCFGWIDGVRKNTDRDSYTIRFTPRRPRSTWSLVNVRHAERLIAAGRMRATGLRAFRSREAKRTGTYSFEQRPRSLPAPLEATFREDAMAWAHWGEQPPGYRRTATWWVVSAVRDETQRKRLSKLVSAHAGGRRIGLLI